MTWWLDYAAIRMRVSLRDVLNLLQWQPLRQSGAQARGTCPFCHAHSHPPDRKRTFSVHFTRQVYRCFRCHRSGNPLDLWIDHTQLPVALAAIDLCQRLRIPLADVTSRNAKPAQIPPQNPQPTGQPPRHTGLDSGRE